MREGLEPVEDELADRLLVNGQPLGGPAPAAPLGLASADPRGVAPATADGLSGPLDPSDDLEDPPQNAALTFGVMPEQKDALSDCVSQKIPKLIEEGYPQDQAVAIAYSMCAEGKSAGEAAEALGISKKAVDADDLETKALGDIDTRPPQGVADNARRALEVRARKPESQRGMTAVGIARARDLANRVSLSEDTIRRMVAYFERHEVDKQGSTWDDQGKGWQAWYGWGGDDGFAWAKRKVEEFNRERERNSERKKKCACGCRCGSISAAEMEQKDCGTGAGGFQEGNTCGQEEGGSSDSDSSSRQTFDGGVDEYLDESTDASVKTDFDDAIGNIEIDTMSDDDVKFSTVVAYQGDGYRVFTGQGDAEITQEVEESLSNFGYLSDAEMEQRIDDGESEEDLQAEQDMSRDQAIAKMRETLEAGAASSRIKCCVRLMRGLYLQDSEVDEMIESGFVSHEGANSWTTKTSTARRFSGAEPGSKYGPVRLVVEKPKVGYVNQNNSFEAEIIRPPSSMKISKVVTTKTGTLIYVEEDERL